MSEEDAAQRVARATAAAKLSTASKARDTESPGVAQPQTARTEGDPEVEEGETRDPDAHEKAHLGSGTAN